MEALIGLFWVAFLAATIVPFYSEIAVATMVLAGHDPFAVWAWATAGNTLGAVLNWALAGWLARFEDRRWFPFGKRELERARRWYARYGVWSLLLSWAPIGGDALTFAAGLMKTRLAVFLPLVAAGKGARYAVLLWLVDSSA